MAAGAEGDVRAVSASLEGLQRKLLALPEGDPGREDVRRDLAEAQVTLANLLALPPKGALSAQRVLSLLEEPA